VTQEQIVRFRKTMENKRRELVGDIRAQTGQIVIIGGDHDPIDQIQSMHLREANASQLGRRSQVLTELERSLQAISEGSYGICIDCEEPISLKRLESLPWARRCIPCQQVWECRDREEQRAA
jgi:DnaK suppressor protein